MFNSNNKQNKINYNHEANNDSGETKLQTSQNYVVSESPIQIIRSVPSLSHPPKSRILVQIDTAKVVNNTINHSSRPQNLNYKVKTYEKTDKYKDTDFKAKANNPTELDLQFHELKTTKTDQQTKTSAKNSETMIRSKSDLYYDPKTKIPAERGTLSSRIAPWKSTINIPVAVEKLETKKKSYNREDARRFMEEQKKKRKSNLGKENNKNEINRDEIKKRLQILQKNTKEILQKNVKTLARKRVNNTSKEEDIKLASPTKNRRLELIFKPNPARSGVNVLKDLIVEENKRENVQPKETETVRTLDKHYDQDTKQKFLAPTNSIVASENVNKILINNETTPSLSYPEPKTPVFTIAEIPALNKKIGLLRKPESEDHSFSALNDIKTDKETAILNMITPKVRENLKSDNNEDKSNSDHINKKSKPNSAHSSKSSFTVKAAKRFSNEFQLDVPECTLKTNLQEKSVQADPSIVFRQNEEVPFWLKPNPVQVYPYNFIMAVRKKLEAITNPVVKTAKNNTSTSSKDDNRKKLYDSTPVSYRKDKRSINVKRRLTSTAEETSYSQNNFTSDKSHPSKISLSESSYSFSSDKRTENKSKHISTSSKNSEKMPGKLTTKVGKDNSVKSSENVSYKFVDNTKTKESNPSLKLKTFDLPNLDTYNKYPSKIDDSIGKLKDASKSLSEITSNFSSISIHVPESNTVSEVSSIRSETNHDFLVNQISTDKKQINEDDNTTTASSSVFSSPEKNKKSNTINSRALSPLSVENISNLNIKSSGKSKQIPKGITMEREYNPEIPPLDLKNKHSDYSKSSDNNASDRSDVDINQLLEDFNRSLSQVIEVNDQLKETLNKTNSVVNNNAIDRKKELSNQISAKSMDDYFSDFEELLSSVRNSNQQNKNIEDDDHKVPRFNSEVSTLKSPDSIHSSRVLKLESFETSNGKIHHLQTEQTVSYVTPIEALNSSECYRLKSKSDTKTQSQSSSSKPLSGHNSKISSVESENTDKTISEEINEYSNKENNSGNIMNQFSKDSLDIETDNEDTTTVSKRNYIKSNINSTRGDFNDNFDKKMEIGPPGYVASEKFNVESNNLTNSSVGSEFIAIFNQSDVEMSIYSHSRSETMNYSSIGMYEQLIRSESNKSDQLASLLKMREKALLDRTKGQIAWLELQKEKYKSEGLTMQISAVKKKQRAVLMKMEKEREEIKKLLKNQTIATSKQFNSKSLSTEPQQQIPKIYHPKLVENLSDIAIRKSFSIPGATNSLRSNSIIRGYELEGSKSVELLLQKREEELRKRRAHVEKLMEWHQRLDQEEQEVLQLEQLLLDCNDQKQQKENIQNEREMKKERKLKEIDNSLRELNSISSKSALDVNESVKTEDFVHTTGNKLNKLWRRLTSQKLEKFEPTKKYKLCKIDLEKIYEEAKAVVIAEFGNTSEMNKLFNKSNSICSAGGSDGVSSVNESHQPIILSEETNLNLNFSSGQSENECQENYSLNLADEKFAESQSSPSKNIESISISINHKNLDKIIKTNALDSQESVLKLDLIQKDCTDTEVESIISNNVSESHKSKSQNVQESSKMEKYDRFESIETTESTINSDDQSQYLSKNEDSNKTLMNVEQITSPEPCSTVNSYIAENITDNIKTESNNVSNTSETEKNISWEDEPEISSEQKIMNPSQSSSIVEEVETPSVVEDVVTPSKLSSSDILSNLTDNDLTIGNQKNSTDGSDLNDNHDYTSSKLDGIVSDELSHKSRSSVIISEVTLPTGKSSDSDTIKGCSKEENYSLTISETVNDIGSQDSESNYENANKEVSNDFSYGEETFLDDITAPIFEKTFENEESVLQSNIDKSKTDTEDNSETLEKRLICIDISLKGLQNTFDRALSPEKINSPKIQPTPPPFHSSVPVQIPTKQLQITTAMLSPPTTFRDLDGDKESKSPNTSHQLILNKDFNKMAQNSANNLMPDIISEVEIRRQQILLENEIKQLEQTVPYNVYLREIPNKPPPPYVPPAHGSPMTTIFPSEERIKEITFRRTKELYDEIVTNDINKDEQKSKPPSVLDENITNIYERIILDICKECMTDYQATLTVVNPENYKNPLAFYNPPDRSKCMQNFVYKQVRKYLAMDKCRPKRNSIFGIGRRKRDHVDEILVQELFEEEAKWTNFDIEEAEVKATIIDEICNDIIRGVIDEVFESHKTNNSNIDSESINAT